MKTKILLAAAVAASSAALLAFAPRATESAAPAPASAWNIDPVHSSGIFRCKHFNTAYVFGRLDKITGTIDFDEANPAASTMNVEVSTESIHTGQPPRDNHLKSDAFLDSKEFPTATFKSKEFKKGAGDNTFDVRGDFTLRGVTKEITVKLEKTGQGKNPQSGADIIGFESTFTIDRLDYGVKFMPDALGHDVRITVSLEAGKKP